MPIEKKIVRVSQMALDLIANVSASFDGIGVGAYEKVDYSTYPPVKDVPLDPVAMIHYATREGNETQFSKLPVDAVLNPDKEVSLVVASDLIVKASGKKRLEFGQWVEQLGQSYDLRVE